MLRGNKPCFLPPLWCILCRGTEGRGASSGHQPGNHQSVTPIATTTGWQPRPATTKTKGREPRLASGQVRSTHCPRTGDVGPTCQLGEFPRSPCASGDVFHNTGPSIHHHVCPTDGLLRESTHRLGLLPGGWALPRPHGTNKQVRATNMPADIRVKGEA